MNIKTKRNQFPTLTDCPFSIDSTSFVSASFTLTGISLNSIVVSETIVWYAIENLKFQRDRPLSSRLSFDAVMPFWKVIYSNLTWNWDQIWLTSLLGSLLIVFFLRPVDFFLDITFPSSVGFMRKFKIRSACSVFRPVDVKPRRRKIERNCSFFNLKWTLENHRFISISLKFTLLKCLFVFDIRHFHVRMQSDWIRGDAFEYLLNSTTQVWCC